MGTIHMLCQGEPPEQRAPAPPSTIKDEPIAALEPHSGALGGLEHEAEMQGRQQGRHTAQAGAPGCRPAPGEQRPSLKVAAAEGAAEQRWRRGSGGVGWVPAVGNGGRAEVERRRPRKQQQPRKAEDPVYEEPLLDPSKLEAPKVPVRNVSTRSTGGNKRARVASPGAASPASAPAYVTEAAAAATVQHRHTSSTESPGTGRAASSFLEAAAAAPSSRKRPAEWDLVAACATRSRAAAGEVEVIPPLPEAALAAAERRTNRREALAASAAFAAAASGEEGEGAEPSARGHHSLGPAARFSIVGEEGRRAPANKPGQSTAIAMMVGNLPTAFKVIRKSEVGSRSTQLVVPQALSRLASMLPGPITVVSEAGDEWESNLLQMASSGRAGIRHKVYRGWYEVAEALHLEPGQSVCLAALSVNRMLISRPGEPHFVAAAAQGPPDPWPLAVRLSQKSAKVWFPLSLATGRSICTGGVLSVHATIVACQPDGISPPTEHGVAILSTNNKGYQDYRISAGWPAVARAMSLKVGDRVLLEPICRGPWSLRISMLPPQAAPPVSPAAVVSAQLAAEAAQQVTTESAHQVALANADV